MSAKMPGSIGQGRNKGYIHQLEKMRLFIFDEHHAVFYFGSQLFYRFRYK